jgi:hypothetical protein
MGSETQSVSDLVTRAMRRIATNVKKSFTPMVESDPAEDDSSDFDEPTALVCAALRPRPHAGAGAIALPEPDDRYPLA